jgi:hypothetical protein
MFDKQLFNMAEKSSTTKRIAAVVIIENVDRQLLLLNRNYEPYGFCLLGGKIDLHYQQ